jgi:hypothetical protein
MPEWLRFVLAAFVCYRLAELVTVDDGPGNVFKLIRAKLGAYYLGADGLPETSLGRAAICPWCVGIWIAAGLALILFPVGPMMVLWWLAIAGAQAFLQGVAGRV